MRTRLWLAVGAVVAIASVTGLSAHADLLQQLIGILPGGPTALLPSAAITSDADPVPPGAQKQPLSSSGPFEATCPGGATVTNGQFGFVVLNTSGPGNSKVKAEIVIKDGIPNVTYDVYLHQNPGDCPTLRSGTITTDSQGNGNGQIVKNRAPGSTHFWSTGIVADPLYFPSNPKSLLRTVSVALD